VQEIRNTIEQMQCLFVQFGVEYEGVGALVRHERAAPQTPPLVEDVDV
jgi:hypothetical protein